MSPESTVQKVCTRWGMTVELVPTRLLTPDEAAARLRVKRRTLLDWAAAGRLDVVHLTRRTLRYPEASVNALINGAPAPRESEER